MMGVTVDWEQLDAIADGWSEEFLEIYRDFLGETMKDWEHVAEAVKANDATQTARMAHRVKGSSANFGFEGVREAAFALEMAAKEGDLSPGEALLQQGREMYAICRKEVALRVPSAA